MNDALLLAYVAEVLLTGAIFTALPRIARRGLLFGVHVGTESWASAAARAVTRAWYRRVAIAIAASLLLFLAAARWWSESGAFLVGSLMLVGGCLVAYARCHGAARRLAADATPPAVAMLQSEPAPALAVPLLTLALVLLVVAAMSAYALSHYDEMPDRIPVHFDAAGRPDGWARKALVEILLLPAMTLVLGGFLVAMAAMMPHAKRGLRHPGTARSAEAGRRFRIAISRFLCAVAVAVTGVFALIHTGQVRTALGQAASLGPLVLIVTAGMILLSLGGVIYLMTRYGQAGARIEEAGGAAGGELTDGLADDRCWKWGLLYVNRDDPSIFVEKRFGFGYTINLGNPRAIAFFGGFFIVLIALIAVAAIAG
jgi:uncharacterized membrane protein